MTNIKKVEVILDGFPLDVKNVELYYDDYMLGSLSVYGGEISQKVEAIINHYVKSNNEVDLIILDNISTYNGSEIVTSAEKQFEGTIKFDKQYNTKFCKDSIITTFSFAVIEKR